MTRHLVEVAFDDFGWAALEEEAAQQHLPVPDLVAYAAMYYLADVGRSQQLPRRRPLDLGPFEPEPPECAEPGPAG